MKRVILALAAIVGLSRSAEESNRKYASPTIAQYQRYLHLKKSRLMASFHKQEDFRQQNELELQRLDTEIELTASSLYNLKECEDQEHQPISEPLLHQEIRSLAMDISYALEQNNVGYAARATAQARYLERCLENGQGVLELYRAHFQAIEQEDYQDAFRIAQEIGNASLEFETQQMMPIANNSQKISQLETVLLRMSDVELEESARYVTPSTASAWIESCIENKASHQFLFYDFGAAERSCLAALIRVDNFSLWPYDVEDSLEGMRLYSFQDVEIKCQLETFRFLFGKEVPRLSLTMYEFRDECLVQSAFELRLF